MSFETGTPEDKPKWPSANIPAEFVDSRTYSKEHYPERRQKRADEIRANRTAYFQDKKRKQERAGEELPDREEQKLRVIEEMKLTQDQLERNAKKLRLSIFEKIIGPKKILEKSRNSANDRVVELEADLINGTKKLQEIESQIHWLTATINDSVRTSDFPRLRERAIQDIEFDNQFYDREHAAHEKKREEQLRHRLRLLEEGPDRTIEHFAEHENVFFVHGTHPSFDPSENSAIVDGLSWQQKARLAVGLEPTLSTSSIRPSIENFENIFAGVGLVVGGGQIEYVDRADSDTIPTSLTEFEFRKPLIGGTREREEKDTPTLEYISYVLQNGPREKQKMKHNEIVVSGPKPVGIYFVADEISDADLQAVYAVPEHTEINSLANELSLPVFAFRDGRFYQAAYDKESATYRFDDTEELSPETFIQLPNVAPEIREKIVTEAYANQEDLFKVSLNKSE